MTLQQAVALHQRGQLAEAERLYRQFLTLEPQNPAVHFLFGLVCLQQGRHDEAIVSLDRVIALDPGNPDAHSNRAIALCGQKRFDEALKSFDAALALKPSFADAWRNRGAALSHQEKFADAVASFNKALTLRPDYAEVWNDRGAALRALHNYGEALASFDKALALNFDVWRAHYNRAVTLSDLGRSDEALASFDAAITANPRFAMAFYHRGSMLWAKKQDLQGAIRDITAALALEPDYPYARGHLLHLKMYAGDWTGFAEEKARIDQGIRVGKPVAEPFVYVALSDNPADLLACAKLYAAAKFPPAPAVWRGTVRRPGKIRLGYVSGEFRQQATAFLTAGLYEHHDKTRFELVAIDNGGSDGSPMRARLETALDRFVDISRLGGDDAARLVREQDIDILVNLNGYFGKMRTDLFARRPAPIQVNFLGFPGSMGAPYMDYILADAHVIRRDEQLFFAEQVVTLPHCYQVNDDRRGAVVPDKDRAAHGLPQNALVFCYFNQSYKLAPGSFSSWMRILSQVDGSVLWLFENSALLAGNLRREAAARGVDPSRLIFAPYREQSEHLSRLALGDLFLDSLPYGAHTTASDALWAGLPLITQTGNSFAGRVATSLLHAAGLPELVTSNEKEFEALAIALARDPARLAAIRQRLASVSTTPLFDTKAYCRHLEAAYLGMMEKRGEAPGGFSLQA
jgi:protein O-GlcNAc transferase